MNWTLVFSIGWVLWLLTFLALEIPAAWMSYHHLPGNTLSERIWRFLGNGPYHQSDSGWVRLHRLAFAAFSAWLVIHLLTGGWM